MTNRISSKMPVGPQVSDEHRAKILKPEDVGAAVLMIANLPPRAHIPELTIKPTWQVYV